MKIILLSVLGTSLIILAIVFNQVIKKMMNDTLTEGGRYSRKSLQMFASFILAAVTGFIIIYRHEVNDSAIEVFWGFLFLSGGMGVLTVWDKIRGDKTKVG